MNRVQKFALVLVMCVVVSAAVADSLELKNGSLVKGRFMGGDQNSINFQVGSSFQTYNVGDIRALRFDSEPEGADVSVPSAEQQYMSVSATEAAKVSSYVTIPAGKTISVRTIDAIDSGRNHVGDRFQASLEEPLIVDDKVVAAKGADVYGRLEESKETGTFTGRSELKLALTGIVVDGKTVPIVTGDYELTGSPREQVRPKEPSAELQLEASSVQLPAVAKGRQSELERAPEWAPVRRSSRKVIK